MKRILIAGIAAGGLLLGGAAVAAEKPGQWYVAPMASMIWADNDRLVDDEVGAAFSIGRAISDNINLELHSFGYQLEGIDDTDLWGIGFDVMRVFYRPERISPYLSGGFGWNVKNSNFASDDKNMFVGAAFGILADLTPNVALRSELRYRVDYNNGWGGETFNDLIFNVGLQIPFGQPYAEPVAAVAPPPPPPPPPPADSDGDGVPDSRDKCPGTPAGVAVDTDGCPLDTDGDGVPDFRDACPGTPAGARVDSRGCPITDVISLEGVTFAFNSDQITADERGTLNEAVDIMRRYPDINVQVAGHTDSVGNDAYNQSLSERRARSVLEFLAAAGIDRSRMTARGYGEASPIADNATDAGRAMNRRVELRIID